MDDPNMRVPQTVRDNSTGITYIIPPDNPMNFGMIAFFSLGLFLSCFAACTLALLSVAFFSPRGPLPVHVTNDTILTKPAVGLLPSPKDVPTSDDNQPAVALGEKYRPTPSGPDEFYKPHEKSRGRLVQPID